jgi:predicted dehydrogenase
MSEKLQALVIGCGKIGGALNTSRSDAAVMTHALAYVRDERFTLAACVEPDKVVREDFMKRWSVPQGFSSLDAALSSGLPFDVASVASPTNTHEKILLRLLDSPVKGVLAEKPLGGAHALALQIVEAYEKENKPLLVCYLRRFDPAMEALRKEIAAGTWGAFKSATIQYCRGIMNNGSHGADLLSFLTGRTDFKFLSAGSKLDDGVAGDPTVDATLTLGDATLHFVACDGRDFAIFETVLVFEKGVVALEENGFIVRRRPVASDETLPGIRRLGIGASEKTGLDAAFPRALDALYNVIHANGAAPSTGRTALAAIRICETIRDAARNQA